MTRAIRLGSLLLPTDPYWVQAREAVKQRAQTLGIALVNFNLPFGSATGDQLLGLIEQLLAQELDALITPRLPEAVARQLVAAGLPLVFTDEMSYEGPGMVSPRGLYDAGALAGAFMLDQIGYQGTVLLVGGQEQQLATVQARVNGFCHALASQPAVRCVQAPTLWRYDIALAQLLEESGPWLPQLAGQPVAGIFGLSDSLALAGRDAGRQLGLVDSRTRIVGINGDPLAIAAIVEGTMHGTVETSAHELARDMVHYACLAARGESLPPHFPYALRLVTSENAAAVATERLVEIADLPTRLVDVSRRQEEQRLLHMQASLEINQRVGAILDTAALLQAVGEIIGSRYDADCVQFYFWRDDEQCLEGAAPAVAGAVEVCLPLAESGVLGQALLRKQAVYVPDLQTSQRFAPDPRWPALRSRVVLPSRVGGVTLGVLDLQNHKRKLRTQVELDALQTLADQVGVALRNAQLYAEAVAAKEEAERANLLRTRLLANASHELRTPLNIILGYSESALSEPNPYNATLPQELRADLTHIHQGGSQLLRLVDDLLSLSLAEIGALETVSEPLDAHALLTEVFASMAGNRHHHAVDWRLELPTALPVLYADPVRLRQVLHDLLSNADKHTSAGHITLRGAQRTDQLHIWVEDTGAGIPRAQQQRINDYLAAWDETEGEADRHRFGIGLGLTVARHIVRLHGGVLQVESQPGHGTICHVRLPLAAAPPVAAQSAASVHDVSGPAAQERVLNNILNHASELPRRIATYLSNNYASAVSRGEIARTMQVSADYVSRTFRNETGMTPWEFLNRYRILQAQKLLLNSSHNITEIAALVGFNDPGYFVRVFHRETGKSPQQYRKSAK